MFATEELYLKAVEAGIVDIFCSYTGLCIGSLAADIVFDLIEAELSMNPELDDEALLDHLSLLVIPMNARPAPIFQNMTQTRYRWIAQNQPESMFRYLAGKLVFERWTHVNGHINHGGKLEWLKTIESLNIETEDFKETLKTMIRFDAAISLRRAYFSHDMLERLTAIQNEWPGFDAFAKFVEDLESSNLTRLERYDPRTNGQIRGNSLAVSAALSQVRTVTPEEWKEAHNLRRKSEILHDLRRENKSKNEMLKVSRKFDEISGGGNNINIKRGFEAILDYANLGDTFDSKFVLESISKLDVAKMNVRELKRVNRVAAMATLGQNPKTAKPKKESKPAVTKSGLKLTLKLNSSFSMIKDEI
jgi:hypothetical protein